MWNDEKLEREVEKKKKSVAAQCHIEQFAANSPYKEMYEEVVCKNENLVF